LIDIAYSSYFRLSLYTWGILLGYIRHRLSSRFHFYLFWEAEHDKYASYLNKKEVIFLISEHISYHASNFSLLTTTTPAVSYIGSPSLPSTDSHVQEF